MASTAEKGGNIVLLDVFLSDGEKGLRVENMLTMPVELVRLVTPLAKLIEKQLAEEVYNLNKSKRKKKDDDMATAEAD